MSTTVAVVRSRVPRIAGAAVARARLTVVPRRRVRAARMPFVALVSMVLLGGVVGLLLFNTSMQQAAFATTELQRQADTLAARQQTLQMDLDRLRDPQRIAAAAVRLHMVQAGNVAFLDLRSGRVVGEPSPGAAATTFPIWPKAPAKPAELRPKPRVVWVAPPAADAAHAGEAGEAANPSRDTAAATAGSGRPTGKKNLDASQQSQPSR